MHEKISFFILALTQLQFSLQEPLVQLPNGEILGGTNTTLDGTSYYSFQKIPYAAPPVGDLRFKVPQPVENWEGVLETTWLDVVCFQLGGTVFAPSISQSEDCLYLNVHTPKLGSDEDDGLLPVMVFIHGGGFMSGSALWYHYPPDLFMDNDVILVTFNYRLGIFGFLSTGDDIIPGNNGLKDQILALRWVHDNIQLFGGDPEKVTIFGQGAGAGSCAYHVLNQNLAGLFNGVILQSGTFLSTRMFQRSPRKIAFGVGAVLNSTFETNEDSEALLEFLQTIRGLDLTQAAFTYGSNISKPWDSLAEVGNLFAPVIEVKNPDAVLTEKMYVLLNSGKALHVPIIMGFTSEEKIGIGQDADELNSILSTVDENLAALVPPDMPITDQYNRTQMGRAIREIYTVEEPMVGHFAAGIKYSSDTLITRAMRKHAELSQPIAPTYFYQFSFYGTLDKTSVLYDGAERVGRGSELEYLFCYKSLCNYNDLPEADFLTRQRLITLWTNFAKFGDPTPEASELLQNFRWPLIGIYDGDFFYLDINDNLQLKNRPKQETYWKWIKLYDSLGYDDFDTY